jgi:hypothetical protein
MGHPWAKQHENIYKGRKYLIQGVSGGVVNILGGGSMDSSE